MTELYAQYTAGPPEEVDLQVEAIRKQAWKDTRARRLPQREYKRLPWTMEELPGTVWCNAYTFHAHQVKVIAANRYGKLGPDPDPWINAMFEIGLWREDQFCIEHWFRIDHLDPAIQQQWAIRRVAYCRKELQRARATDCTGSVRKCKIEWAENDLEEARQALLALSEQHGLDLPTRIENVGVCPGEQLALI